MVIMARFTARKIYKQVYPGTYTFKGDTDASEPTGWTTNNGGTTTTLVIASQGVHRKVLKCVDDDGANTYDIEIDFSSAQTVGKIDLWFQTDDNAVIGYLQLLAEDNTIAIQVDLNAIAGVGDDTWYHYSIDFDCTPDTYEHWLDGTSIASGVAFTNAVASIFTIKFTSTAGAQVINYYDAIGFSWDSDYVFGDNIFWRNLKDQDSAFELEDLYTTGNSIGFVDTDSSTGLGFVKIIPFFDEHKKVLECYADIAGAANDGLCVNDFSGDQVSGTYGFLVRTTDATRATNFKAKHGATEVIDTIIFADFIRSYQGAAFTDVLAASDNVWYLIKIEFECGAGAFRGLAADTYYMWINNVQYGPFDFENAVDHIDSLFLGANINTSSNSCYFDAISYSWTSGNQLADNRTFGYHIESYDDITSNIEECIVIDSGVEGSTAAIMDDTTITINELHIIQLYDENGDLRFEGNIMRTIQSNLQSQYPLISFNNDELLDENSYTASSAEDVNASLLAIHTNVSQTDGRLIYYTEDDPAGNLTPNFRNKPKNMGIRWFAIHGGKIATLKSNGVFFLDEDRNPENGAETITASTGELLRPPRISTIKHQINYVEVRGAINPDTGTPFSGISQDATAQTDGTGIKRYYKRFRELQSDADCANRATQIRTGSGFSPTVIETELRSVYAIPGEIINFAYAPLSFSATNMYVEAPVAFNLIQGTAKYRLNTGIFDAVAMNTPGYTIADETADDIGETLFNTDLIPIDLTIRPLGSATWSSGYIVGTGVGDGAIAYFWIDGDVDDSREIVITWSAEVEISAGSMGMTAAIESNPADDSNDTWTVEASPGFDLSAKSADEIFTISWTLPASGVNSTYLYRLRTVMNDNFTLNIYNIQIKYFMKRTVGG